MSDLATAAQMRELDRRAIEERGIPSLRLMEKAAERVYFHAAISSCPRDAPIAIFAGAGNNGGDGIALARLLRKRGYSKTRAFLAGSREKMSEDCREMARRYQRDGGILEDFQPGNREQAAFAQSARRIVDAILGVGLNKPLQGAALDAARLINASRTRVISVDIPTGVEADTGRVLGDAVRANYTVTFTLGKPGLYVGRGAACAGAVDIRDIGIPRDLLAEATFLSHAVEILQVRQWLPRRDLLAHKGNFGKILIIGGSAGYTGAPVLAARGALRCGAGLVTAAVPEMVYPIVAAKCDEAMVHPLPDEGGRLSRASLPGLLELLEGKDAALVGPGLGWSGGAEELACALVEGARCPLVVDADGLNALSRHMDILEERRGRATILTPHDGEFARLGGDLSSGDRLDAARRFAERYGCILVLKGHGTVTALPDGNCYVNTTGNPGMAVGGSGDALAGMILSLLGQGLPPERAVPCAVWLHGRAGDMAARDKGEYGMLPSDLIEQIPYAIQELFRG